MHTGSSGSHTGSNICCLNGSTDVISISSYWVSGQPIVRYGFSGVPDVSVCVSPLLASPYLPHEAVLPRDHLQQAITINGLNWYMSI